MKKRVTEIERYVIDAVRKRRLEIGVSQKELSMRINVDVAYVGHVESINSIEKYNLNQLNEIAKALECRITDFFPDPFVAIDCIEEYNRLHPNKHRNTTRRKL